MRKGKTKTFLLAAAAAAALAALLAIPGWRLDTPRISQTPGARNRVLSPAESDDLCRESMILLPGVSPKTTPQNFHGMLQTKFGEASAKELFDDYRDERLIVGDGKLFFPTLELCRQPQLPSDCSAFCRRWNKVP